MNTTNLLGKGEVTSANRLLAANEHQRNRGPGAAPVSSAASGYHGVVEDGMVGRWCELSRESPVEQRRSSWSLGDPKNRRHEAVRASIVVRKRGNARGAKGRRKMDAP